MPRQLTLALPEIQTARSCLIEEWRDIPGYEGMYQASTFGRIRSLTRMVRGSHGSTQMCRGSILVLDYRGRYPQIHLCKNARHKRFRIHDLVLRTFIGKRPKGMEARHFPDRDPRNNRIDNLQWGTKRENQNDKIVHGTINSGERCGTAKLTSEQVIEIRNLCRSRKYPQTKIAAMFGVKQQEISKIKLGIRWGHLKTV